MPRHFQQPKANYKNVDEFRHAALHTLTHLYAGNGRGEFNVFDVQEKDVDVNGKTERFYVCIGYKKGEKVPPPPTPGKPVGEVESLAESTAEAATKAAIEAGDGVVNATDFAVELAVKNGINLVDVAKTLPQGKRIGKDDVVKFLKSAPQKDTANDGKSQLNS